MLKFGTAVGAQICLNRLALLGILLLAAALRLLPLTNQPLWIDEAFSLWLAEQSIPQIVSQSAHLDQHPPLFYLALHFARAGLGRSTFALRLPAALASIAAVPLLFVTGARLHGQTAGLLAALLLALSPLHVRYAQEARMYAPLTLAVAASLYFFVRLSFVQHGFVQAEHSSTFRRSVFPAVGLTLSAAATLYLHNISVLWLVTLGYAMWFVARPFSLRSFWLWGALLAAGALWLPWLPTFLAQAAAVDARFWLPPPTPSRILNTLGELALVLPGAWGTSQWLLPTLSLALCLPLATLAARWHSGRLLARLWALPLVLALLISLLRRSIFSTHALLWLALPLLLLTAIGAATLAPRSRQIAVAGLCALALFSLTHVWRAGPKEAWDQAATHVAAHVEPGDLLLFHAGWARLPFGYYFDKSLENCPDGDVASQGSKQCIPLVAQHSLPDGLFARGAIEPRFTLADLAALRAQIAGRERVWLIYSHVWYSDPDDLALRYLKQERTLIHEQAFPGVALYLFGS